MGCRSVFTSWWIGRERELKRKARRQAETETQTETGISIIDMAFRAWLPAARPSLLNILYLPKYQHQPGIKPLA